MTCRCRVLEADIEEIERDRDDALALLRRAWWRLDADVHYYDCEASHRSLLTAIAERFPELAR